MRLSAPWFTKLRTKPAAALDANACGDMPCGAMAVTASSAATEGEELKADTKLAVKGLRTNSGPSSIRRNTPEERDTSPKEADAK